MAFSEGQVQALSGKLSAKHVRTRQMNGRTLSYIEGWHAIAEANRIFGFDAWDRQTMAIKCVWEGTWQGKYRCAYVARVRVKVRAGDSEICREGCGSGQGRGNTPGEAHESALKEAETDAMKRALTTFGNSFGLALYDKAQHGVRGKAKNNKNSNGPTLSWILLSAEGEVISLHEDPVDYCKALRQVIEAGIEMLRANLRDLRTEAGEHFADILLSLYQRQLKELHEEQGVDQAEAEAAQKTAQAGKSDQSHGNRSEVHDGAISRANGTSNSEGPNGASATGQVDKSTLPISAPRRVRDKEHLRLVASQPCLVCGRSPGHAHHIRYAQPRAMGRKVSDEWTVPLCATHHRALHTVGDEEKWWKMRGIDPVTHAEQLWREKRGGAGAQPVRARELIRPAPC
jgi:DNA recombination protein Rad52